MLILFTYTFCNNVPAGALNYHLLNNIGINYTFIYFISVLYPLFLAFGLPIWKRVLGRAGWFKTFAISELTLFPTYVMYSFVTKGNYLWLWFTLRLMQHFFGIGA
jgi:Na+/melibiose symporter-like transporter